MSHGTIDPKLADDSMTDAKLRDSTGLSVIGRSANSSGDPADIVSPADVGKVLAVVYGPTLGFSYSGYSGPEIFKYHPDREPPVGLDTACSDNFLGNAEQLSWRWGNQGSSTLTNEMDTEVMVPEVLSTESMRCRWITAPNAVNFIMTARMSIARYGATNFGGIQVLSAGDETTPTAIDRLLVFSGGTPSSGVQRDHTTSYTSGGAGVTSIAFCGPVTGWPTGPYYLQMRYTASSKSLASYFSADGETWRSFSSRTLAAHPISIGWFGNTSNATSAPSVRIFWFRTFTEGVNGATDRQFRDGQCGW